MEYKKLKINSNKLYRVRNDLVVGNKYDGVIFTNKLNEFKDKVLVVNEIRYDEYGNKLCIVKKINSKGNGNDEFIFGESMFCCCYDTLKNLNQLKVGDKILCFNYKHYLDTCKYLDKNGYMWVSKHKLTEDRIKSDNVFIVLGVENNKKISNITPCIISEDDHYVRIDIDNKQ